MFSEIIDYIKNLLPFPIDQNDNDDQDWNITPPNSPTPLGTRTPPHTTGFGEDYYNADPPSLFEEEYFL